MLGVMGEQDGEDALGGPCGAAGQLAAPEMEVEGEIIGMAKIALGEAGGAIYPSEVDGAAGEGEGLACAL